MKKITVFLFSLLLTSGFAYAQETTEVFSEDFSDGVMPQGWTLIDEDGDGHNFQVINYADAPTALVSYSFDNNSGPLTPDNYVITPAIPINGITSLELSYEVGGQDPDWSLETYTVYVSTGNTVADFQNDEISFSLEEYLGDDPSTHGDSQVRVIENLEMFDDAEEVYIAFRHHNSTDQFAINFRNIALEGEGTLGTDKHYIEGFAHFVNGKELTIKAGESIGSLDIYNLLGQSIYTATPNNTITTASLDNLTSGIYIGEITVEGVKKSFKFVIK